MTQRQEHDKYNVSNVYVGADGVYVCGFPSWGTVKELVGSARSATAFYDEKTRPTMNIFKLFPKNMQFKQQPLVDDDKLEVIPEIATQFSYEEEYEGTVYSSASKKKNATATTLNPKQAAEREFTQIKRTPILRIYQSNNPVLKDEYTIIVPLIYSKISRPEEEKECQNRIQKWVEVGYHVNILQAFKLQNSMGRLGIFVEKVQGVTLRDLIEANFFRDKNRIINSKRILNVLLQIAVGVHYLHGKQFIHCELAPDNIFLEQEKCVKIGNMYNFNGVASPLEKKYFIGASPEYWSPEQGNIYDTLKARGGQDIQSYLNELKLMPGISILSDLYQFGLIILELIYGRFWARGDMADRTGISNLDNCLPEVKSFLIEKADDFLKEKPEERHDIETFIEELLDLYQSEFRNPEDLLWMKFFDEKKYISDLLNNKSVGLYLAGNVLECEANWKQSIKQYPRNLVAHYNLAHFLRMRRTIDDIQVNKNLYLLPESRKRNFYLMVSNLVSLPLLKQPFKTFNFNPKLSRGKEIQLMTNIIEQLSKCKKPKDYIYQKRFALNDFKFEAVFIINSNKHFIGRLRGTNTIYVWNLMEELRPFNYTQIRAPKDPVELDSRTSLLVMDNSFTYLALTENVYLCIFKIDILTDVLVHYQMKDYGSTILAAEFDMRSEVIALGSNEFNIKLINLVSRDVCKVINVGQRFLVNNLRFYDRNSCVGFSCEKSIIFHRIESAKPLFTVRCSAIVSTYRTIESSLNTHVMIVLTLEKFEIWNLKDKVLIRFIEIDEAPQIQNFHTLTNKKIIIHYSKHTIRLWNYSNGLILKSYKSQTPYSWTGVSEDNKYLQSLTQNGTLMLRNIEFDDFLRNFEGACVPNQLSFADDKDETSQDINYIKYGRVLIKHLNEFRINEHEKKVSLDGMYSIAETIKSEVFFQDKNDLKVVFRYLNLNKQEEQKSSKINAHSEEYIFTSHKEDNITAISNYLMGSFAMGDSVGTVRIITPPNTVASTLRPFGSPISYISLDTSTIFISSGTSCVLLQREPMSVVVMHNSYHKHPIVFGAILHNILITGDEQQTILYWNKEKIRRYGIPVVLGEIVGNKLLLTGTDNRIRLYEVNDEGLKQLWMFIGHVMPVYRLTVIDDGIFASYSYDGTVRWWNVPAKICFNYFHFKRYLKDDKVLYVDLPKFTLEEEKHPKFDSEGCALLLVNNSEIVVFDTMRKESKWRLELTEDINRLFWTEYPNSFAVVTNTDIRIYNIYWRYTANRRPN